jgi:hypothetical protein
MWLRWQTKMFFQHFWSFHGVHVGSCLGIFGLFWGYFGLLLPFSWLSFIGQTSYNVIAMARKNVLPGFYVRFRGLLCSFPCHFGSFFGGHFWTSVGVFWDFSVFFLLMFFLVIRPIMWLRGQK